MRSLRFLLKMHFLRSSYLRKIGYWKSVNRREPVDADGNPLPWMPYPMIELLDERLNEEHRVVEYGAGFSSLYFCDRAQSVSSVEHDETWYEKIRAKAPANLDLTYCPTDPQSEYISFIDDRRDAADLIVVDGPLRVECSRRVAEVCGERSVILLDDSEREVYSSVFIDLHAKGFRSLTLTGLKPTKFKASSATIFYRDNNALQI